MYEGKELRWRSGSSGSDFHLLSPYDISHLKARSLRERNRQNGAACCSSVLRKS